MENKDRNEKWLDNSKVSAFETCPRLYFLRYCLHLSAEKSLSPALLFGKAFHSACEHFFKGLDEDTAIETGLEVLVNSVDRVDEFSRDDWRLDEESFARSCLYFFSHTGREIKSLAEVLETEMKIELKDPETDYSYLGRIDLFMKSKTGLFSVIDIKTTSMSITQGWTQKLLVDTQIQGYAYLVERSKDLPVFSGAYAILSARRSRLKSGALSPNMTIDSSFLPLALSSDHLRRAEWRFKKTAQAIETSSFPCNFSSCLHYSKVCQFHPLCERYWAEDVREKEEEIKEVALSSGYSIEKWHPFDD